MDTSSTVEHLNSSLTGRYLIEREIGRGGMATVYLARDLRHERKVALKLLLAELGAILGPERFLSEIRVTANLQHPNLLPLFDSGEAGGRLFYVMPYVEGESLRHRLNREKQLQIDEALRIASACASALDYAHRNNVIHRDLKPENILLSAGQPVIADFGIALAVSNAGGARITQSGLSLGTPQYMSPEQAAGDREVDGRSDIYSLACVLYEMLTGDPPHTGSTVQAVIAKVLVEKPRSIRSQRKLIPEHVEAVIDRALEKLPADRWTTAKQFSDALADPMMTAASRIRSEAGVISGRAHVSAQERLFRRSIWPAIALISVTVAGFAWWKIASMPPPRHVRFIVPTPSTARLAIDPSHVLFAPDGRSIVYTASVGGQRRLYVRPLNELTPREIRGSEDANLPFFSPDGKWIAFATASDILYKVPVTGGAPVQLSKITGWRGGTWNQNGDIVVSGDSGLSRISAGGGRGEIMTRPDIAKGERAHIQPMFLPDARNIVFRIEDPTSRANDQLAITSLDKTGHDLVGVRGGNPLAFIDGKLIYGRPGGFIASVSLDTRKRKTVGEPVILLDEVSVFAGAAASFAQDGSLVYVKSHNASRLIVTDERATATGGGGEARRYTRPRFSPDGRRIAVEISSGGTNRADIWAYDIQSGVLSRLTSQATSQQPEWTPDGKHVVYLRDHEGKGEIWRVPADGSGSEERLFAFERAVREVTLSPDGKLAVFRVENPTTRSDLWLLSLDAPDGSRKATPLVATAFNEQAPRISPDGRWITYISDESGRYEVYVRSFPEPGARVQVSVNGGAEPLWTTNGSRIVYRSGDMFMAAILATGNGISVTGREELFDDQYRSGAIHPKPNYDVDRTGKRFVLLQPVGTPEIVVFLNGFRALLGAAAESR